MSSAQLWNLIGTIFAAAFGFIKSLPQIKLEISGDPEETYAFVNHRLTVFKFRIG